MSSGPASAARSFEPDDDGYDEARRVHNGLIDRRPAVIVRCRSAADAAAALRFARAEGLDVSVRGGGHNVAGRAVADGAVMIDLAEMKAIRSTPTPRRCGPRAASCGASSTMRPRSTGWPSRAGRSRRPGSPA